MTKLIDKHKTLINWYKKKFKLSDYQLLWLVFFKGCLLYTSDAADELTSGRIS